MFSVYINYKIVSQRTLLNSQGPGGCTLLVDTMSFKEVWNCLLIFRIETEVHGSKQQEQRPTGTS